MSDTDLQPFVRSDDPHVMQIEGVGIVRLRVVNDDTIEAGSHNMILWDGLLYSLAAHFGVMDKTWYPVSGMVLTGAGSNKAAPSKIQTPIMTQIAAALNAHLAGHPEIFTLDKILQLEQQEKSYQHQLAQARSQVTAWERKIRDQDTYFKDQLAASQRDVQRHEKQLLETRSELRRLRGEPEPEEQLPLSAPSATMPD